LRAARHLVAGLIGSDDQVGALAIEKGLSIRWTPAGDAVGDGVVVTIIALAILCYTVNLNRIGLHFFYRDRILETYLRSEVESTKTSGGMTPFVSTMEMRLQDVHGNGPGPGGLGNTSPYLLVSAALNLAGSRTRAMQVRHFLFSQVFLWLEADQVSQDSEYLDGRTQRRAP
jgi:hypothetical protein